MVQIPDGRDFVYGPGPVSKWKILCAAVYRIQVGILYTAGSQYQGGSATLHLERGSVSAR